MTSPTDGITEHKDAEYCPGLDSGRSVYWEIGSAFARHHRPRLNHDQPGSISTHVRRYDALRRLGGLAVLCAILYAGYRAWWTPAIGGAPSTGSPAPEFTLTNQQGDLIALTDLTRNGPVIVAFYRGYW